MTGLYLILLPMLRFQDADPPALPSAAPSRGSAEKTPSLDLGLVRKQGLSLKGKGEHSTLPSPAVLNFYTGKIQ